MLRAQPTTTPCTCPSLPTWRERRPCYARHAPRVPLSASFTGAGDTAPCDTRHEIEPARYWAASLQLAHFKRLPRPTASAPERRHKPLRFSWWSVSASLPRPQENTPSLFQHFTQRKPDTLPAAEIVSEAYKMRPVLLAHPAQRVFAF